MKTYKNELDEIIDVVVKLSWSYTIFSSFFEKKVADCEASECEARKSHPEFFLAMHDSLLCSICNAIALLFKEKDKEVSIHSLVKRIEESNPDVAKKLNEQIRVNDGLIERARVVRHQFFAHRYIPKTQQEVFAEAQLRLNDIKAAVELARLLIFEIAGETEKSKGEQLTTQQLSKETLRCVANDANQVMRFFAKSCQSSQTN